MTFIRARVWAETAPGVTKLTEYSEVVELTADVSLYDVGIEALRGYREAVDDNIDVVGHPHSMALILEPFDPIDPKR